MPASIAAQTLCTLILPLARSTETSATPAASVSSFTIVPTPSASRRACAPSPTSRARAQQGLHARLAVRQFRDGMRSGPCPVILGDLVEEALGREALWPLPTPRQGASRARPGITTCSASLFGDRILRDRGALHHDAVGRRRRGAGHGGRIGDDRLGDHAMVPGDELAAGVEARLDVMRGHRAELAEGDVVLAAPDELDRLAAPPWRAAPRPTITSCCAAAAETAAEHMLVERDAWRGRSCSSARRLLSRPVGACVPAQISADLPSALTEAVAFSGSICA